MARPFSSFATLCLALVGSRAAVAQAQQFYTTEANNDRLKIVDMAGTVTDVGALGVNTVNMDLAWHQNVLYGLDRSSLYSIATTGASAGQATFLGTLTANGTLQEGEALASDGTSLYAAFGTPGTNLSTDWGALGLTGVLTPVGALRTEIDGAGFGSGTFWGIDLFVLGDNQNNHFYSGNPLPGTFMHLHGAYPGYTVLDENDVVASIGASLFTVTSSGWLHEWSQVTGTFMANVQLGQAGNYRGLEVVPEPTGVVVLATGLAALLRRRRNRAN